MAYGNYFYPPLVSSSLASFRFGMILSSTLSNMALPSFSWWLWSTRPRAHARTYWVSLISLFRRPPGDKSLSKYKWMSLETSELPFNIWDFRDYHFRVQIIFWGVQKEKDSSKFKLVSYGRFVACFVYSGRGIRCKYIHLCSLSLLFSSNWWPWWNELFKRWNCPKM